MYLSCALAVLGRKTFWPAYAIMKTRKMLARERVEVRVKTEGGHGSNQSKSRFWADPIKYCLLNGESVDTLNG